MVDPGILEKGFQMKLRKQINFFLAKFQANFKTFTTKGVGAEGSSNPRLPSGSATVILVWIFLH
jgi:hypothetical protein